MIDLLHTDCMEYMATQPDNAFDLAIVDPNYGIKQDGRNNHTRTKLVIAKDYRSNSRYDDKPPAEGYFSELFRVSKNQIIWGGNHMAGLIGRNSPCWIVWDKLNGANDFADCELAYTSFQTAVRKFQFQWQGMIQGYGGNKSKNETRIHPNQKPIQLYKWLLENYAEIGHRILDTHLGSGSSTIAAHYFGCDFVGCEIDEDYYKAALNRFNEETKQAAMF